MDDKELAEKVALKLGKVAWLLGNKSDRWVWVLADEDDLLSYHRLESWQVFGLMVEKAAEMGWLFCSNGMGCSFQKEGDFTSLFTYAGYGYHKSCALGFIEIPES